jgi:galactose oxidase
MANLGNAWHLPSSPEPRGRAGMRDPVGAIVPGMAVTIFNGNQFQGDGNPGNQLPTGSSLFFKRSSDSDWTTLPLIFHGASGNNKYYSATIAANTFQTGDVVQYYLRVAYDDHDTTYLHPQGNTSIPTDDEATAQAAPFAFTIEASAVRGQWGSVFPLRNVPVHTSVLPNGRVLIWGRRDKPSQSQDVHQCTPFVWDPVSGEMTNTPQPKLANGTKVNLFCSSHAFLPDGRLLVVGGHKADGDGLDQASLYDWATNTWTPTARMGQKRRRWYPTAMTLPSGDVLVLSGSYIDPNLPPGQQIVIVDVMQVWRNGTWTTIKKADGSDLNFIGLPLYPRMHVVSDGRVFMSGSNAQTYLLKTVDPGDWTPLSNPGGMRINGERQYAPAVMYAEDKVLYIGGGNDPDTQQPTAEAEIIDLSQTLCQWRKTKPMNFRRRQHNATVLPDGAVLVTGGTQGGGPPDMGFNDLAPGRPVHFAELWNPDTEEWTVLAAEQVDRCYHATAVLLPDATVLSAGGGEYRPGGQENDAEDSHRDAQIFSPPYLFKGDRPDITSDPPTSVSYGETFEVGTSQPNDIGKVSWISLPSVTHAFNQAQRINVLQFEAGAGALTVTAPNSANVCPPGHYMMFLLSKQGVPSLARVVQIQAAVAPAAVAAETPVADLVAASPPASKDGAYLDIYARQAAVAGAARGTPVIVGVTGTCPYGIGACWGGAYEALHHLDGVDLVSPIPNADNSTAEVFLKDDRLPALNLWRGQFQSIANGTYDLRGVEVTLEGVIEARDGQVVLTGRGARPPVRLAPLTAADKIQWDQPARARKPLEESEALAYERLAAASTGTSGRQQVTVTGPLKQAGTLYQLHVRLFAV